MVKASRLGKSLQVPPTRSTSLKTKVVLPMKKKIKKATPVRYHDGLSQLRQNAGGIDIGASQVWVDVGSKDPEPTRMFETFTADLNRMGDWLKSCGIQTVAMESTGGYWIPVCQILESKGIEVYLVNARQAENVSGRKSDMLDFQWLRILHSYGLVPASFRPAKDIGVLRAYMRHRLMLIEYAAAHVQHMQKALTQMNLQLQHVISAAMSAFSIRSRFLLYTVASHTPSSI